MRFRRSDVVLAVLAVAVALVLPATVPSAWFRVPPFSLPTGTLLTYRAIELPKPTAEDDEVALVRFGKNVEARAHESGTPEAEVSFPESDQLAVWAPERSDVGAVREQLEPAVGPLGELQFRIEVLPEYPPFHSDEGTDRTRNEVWAGAKSAPGVFPEERFDATRDGFVAFKAREIARWAESRERGEPYRPLDGRYRLVPKYRGEGAAPPAKAADFALVEEPEAKVERMGGEILSSVWASADRYGTPAVSIEIGPAYQRAFHDWTARNVGLPMAIVLNGQYDQAPVINSPLENSVIVSLGGASTASSGSARKAVIQRQRALIKSLSLGSLRGRLRLESVERDALPPLAVMRARRLTAEVLAGLVIVVAIVIAFRRRSPSEQDGAPASAPTSDAR